MENEVKISKFKIFTTKIGNGIKEHSPEILLVAGVGGFIYSTYLACKATTKLSEILKGHEKYTLICLYSKILSNFMQTLTITKLA